MGKEAFSQCPSDSIDYAVMESIALAARVAGSGIAASANLQAGRLPQSVVIPLSAGWSDVGAWEALLQVLPKDVEGNVAQGDVLLQDTRNTLALSEGRLIACVGVDDLIVVETADAILVARRKKDARRQKNRRSAQGRRPLRGPNAPQGVSTLGLVRQRGQQRALSG